MTCKVRDCGRTILARGWCSRHYSQWRRSGRVHTTRWDRNPVRIRSTYAEIGLRDRNGSIRAWTKVNKEDVEHLVVFSRWSIHSGRTTSYVAGGLKQKRILLHRFLLNAPSHLWVDHINGNGLDNRRNNLRLVTPRENARNWKQGKNGQKFRGVTSLGNGLYRVTLSINNIQGLKEARTLRKKLEEVAWRRLV